MTEAVVLTARPKRRCFPGHADQIARARDFTRRVLGPCPLLDEAVLLVSELATARNTSAENVEDVLIKSLAKARLQMPSPIEKPEGVEF